MCALLTCEDNGVGMNQELVERYLIRIGSSYYGSSDFRRQGLDFKPISHFGLGMVSCFMLSDQITVETQHVDESLLREPPLRVELDSAGRWARRLSADVASVRGGGRSRNPAARPAPHVR